MSKKRIISEAQRKSLEYRLIRLSMTIISLPIFIPLYILYYIGSFCMNIAKYISYSGLKFLYWYVHVTKMPMDGKRFKKEEK